MSNLPVPIASRDVTQHPRIGLALGGGGARGLAHILMLEVFDELDLKPHCIAGTSIGAIFGAAYASGQTAQQIRTYAEDILTNRFDLLRQLFAEHETPVQKLFSVVRLRSAILDPRALVDIALPASIPEKFEDLAIPLQIVATDLGRREPVYFSEGTLRSAIAASIAIPVVFSPVSMGDRVFADGGLVDPLPFDILRRDCDITIAIDVSGASNDAAIGPRPGVATMLAQSVQIMQKRLIRERLRMDQPDIYIDVPLDQFGAYQFHKVKDILHAAQPAKAAFKTKLERVLASTPAG